MSGLSGALRSTAIVSLARGVGMALTLLLGMFSAAYFGTSAAKDAFLAAQTIPRLLTTFLVGGVYASLLVTLAEIGQRGGLQGQIAFMRRTLRQIVILLVPSILVVTVFARHIVLALAPGFDASQIDLSASILRISSVTVLGSVSFAVIRCLFEARNRFAVPSSVNLLIGVVSLGSLILLVDRIGIYSLAVGPLLGTLLAGGALAFLAFTVLRDPPDFRAEPIPEATANDRQRRFWIAFLPMCLGTTFGQINLLVDNAFASHLPTGSITLLGFAFVIVSTAELVTAWSLIEVTFPRLASASLEGPGRLSEILRTALRYMLLVTAPLAVGAMTFGIPLARLLFERGEFGPEATFAVAGVLRFYAPEMLFIGILTLMSRTLFARRRLVAVAWISLGMIALNAVLDYLLMRLMGIRGIALATTIVAFSYILVLIPLIRKEGIRLQQRSDLIFTGKVLVCAAVMGGLVHGYRISFEHFLDTGTELWRVVEVTTGLGIGCGLYTLGLILIRVGEVRTLVKRIMVPLASFLRSSRFAHWLLP